MELRSDKEHHGESLSVLALAAALIALAALERTS